MTPRQDLPKLTLPPAFSKKASLGWDVDRIKKGSKYMKAFSNVPRTGSVAGVWEQGWESQVLGSGFGCFSHLLCDVSRSLHLSGLISLCVKESGKLLIQQTWTKDLSHTGTMLRVGDTKARDVVPVSGQLPGRYWEQLVKGEKRREGKLPSLVGEAGGVRDKI